MTEDRRPFFNPRGEFKFTRNRLGHWEQSGGGIYFLTFRLADSLPATVLAPWREQREVWLRENPTPSTAAQEREYHLRFTQILETALDAGYGECVLRDPACSDLVIAALKHFDKQRIALHAAVVMPNHVHALLELIHSHDLVRFITGLKGVTARNINRHLGRTGQPLWQKDYFDRLVRDEAHYQRCIRYVANNPAKAGLAADEYRLFLPTGAAAILPP